MLKTLSTALSLLDNFTPARPAWGVRELAKACGIHHAVVHRMLVTLCNKGFLVRSDESLKYMLGLRFLELGGQVRGRLRLTDVVYPSLAYLAEKTGENVFLTVREHVQGVCVEYAECPVASIKCNVSTGIRFTLTRASHAKVILAYLSSAEQAEAIAFARARNEEVGEDILRELPVIRKQGFCCTQDEVTKDTFGISVPLFSSDNTVLGSICMVGPLFRFDPDAVPRLAALLQTRRHDIEQALQTFSHSKGGSWKNTPHDPVSRRT